MFAPMTVDIITLALLFSPLLLLLGLGFIAAIDPYIRRGQRRVMLVNVALSLTLIAQNLLENSFFVNRSNLAFKNVLSAYGYSVRPVILILFLCIIQPDSRKRLQWGLAGINAALYFSSPFTRLCFEIREGDYVLLRGPLWFACFAVSAILLAELLARTILLYRETGRWERLIPFAVVLVIIVSVVLDINVGLEPQPISFLTIAIAVGSVFYYIWLHLQFVREHEHDLMAAQRIRIMMTQIQPHFLFNALNTIRALYAKDSPLADKTLEDFSTYLRQNLESLSQADLIPIDKELEHTKLYAEIEVLRFPNVRVEYHIEDTQFMVPALTIQPLVENAIRHGVRSRKDGLVTVSTVREAGAHRITVQDNGVGFDPKQEKSTEESHIGLQNVKERVEQMCGGTMTLRSEIGKGTVVTLRIPEVSQTGYKETKR
ncbi:MAG: histidine kinase [Clostridia bacterium]|nr:histidine kinase [Clostridia bacterium]